jgi:hypothetical protein
MVDLAVPKPELVTAEPPQNRIGGDAFQRAPQEGIGAGLSNLASGADDLATRIAKDAGTEAGKQAVTLDANGQPVVDTSLSSPILLGRQGPAYEKAQAAAVEPLLRTGISAALTQMRQEHDLDPNSSPQTWAKNVGDFAQSLRSKYPGAIGEQAFQTAIQQGNQHFANILDEDTKQDLKNSHAAITTALQDAQNRMFSIARQGGSATPEYEQARAEFDAQYQKLKDNAALYGLSPATIDTNKNKAEVELIGHGVVGAIDRAVKDPGPNGGIAGAEKIVKDQITNNPAMNSLDAGTRARLEVQANARIEYNKQENKALIDGNAAASRALVDGYAKGAPPTPEQWQVVHDNAVRLGDVDSVAQLNASRQAYEARRPLASLGAGTAVGAVFDPANTDRYLNKTKGIENPGGNPGAVSPTGAKGDFQFTRGTAADYGVADPTNPAQAREGARQLAIDNAASLTKMLGRAPTEAEVYLAHQQGAGGAGALLAHPNMNAVQALTTYAYGGDMQKADQAIRVNGGDASMTAGQFTNKWISRYEGVPASAGPIPFTPGQIAQNPYLVAAAYRQYDADKSGQIETARHYATGIGNMMRDGVTPSS